MDEYTMKRVMQKMPKNMMDEKIKKIMSEGIRGKKVGRDQAVAAALNMLRRK